jgi:UDP-glucose 4-epimerase
MKADHVAVTGGNGKLGRAIVADLSTAADVVSLDVTPGLPGMRSRYADVLSLESMRHALKGHDAVVHAAAMLQPDDPDDRMFQVNVLGTWNVLQAACEAGIGRIVLLSSECASGIINITGAQKCAPDYLPIDEDHPLRPAETYGLSKQLTEIAAQSYARRGAARIVVLRPTLVLAPGMEDYVRRICNIDDPDLWSYVELCDVVQATRLALGYDGPPYDVFYLSARDTFSAEETLRFMERKFGRLPTIRDAELYRRNPHAAIWDLSRAEHKLGLKPESDWRRFIGLNAADAKTMTDLTSR